MRMRLMILRSRLLYSFHGFAWSLVAFDMFCDPDEEVNSGVVGKGASVCLASRLSEIGDVVEEKGM